MPQLNSKLTLTHTYGYYAWVWAHDYPTAPDKLRMVFHYMRTGLAIAQLRYDR